MSLRNASKTFMKPLWTFTSVIERTTLLITSFIGGGSSLALTGVVGAVVELDLVALLLIFLAWFSLYAVSAVSYRLDGDNLEYSTAISNDFLYPELGFQDVFTTTLLNAGSNNICDSMLENGMICSQATGE